MGGDWDKVQRNLKGVEPYSLQPKEQLVEWHDKVSGQEEYEDIDVIGAAGIERQNRERGDEQDLEVCCEIDIEQHGTPFVRHWEVMDGQIVSPVCCE